MSIQFLKTCFPNPLILASSPLTENAGRIHRGELHGAGGAILKTCCAYERKAGYDTRKVLFSPDHSRYYAYSSFDREILTAEEGLALYHDAVSLCSIPIIPSVTALSLMPEDWLPLCQRFQDAGAELIQLDFFYLGTFLRDQNFSERLSRLLKTLLCSLDCQSMPKVNVELPADYVFQLMADAGIKAVSLLDSVRVPVTDAAGGASLPFSSTSCFGAWQLPLSLHYAYAARQHHLEVCGGGGISDSASVRQMRSCGAALVQVASAVLLHGYKRLRELLPPELSSAQGTGTPVPQTHTHGYRIRKDKCIRCHTCTESSAWCDAIATDGEGFPFIQEELCEACGWCAGRCPADSIIEIPVRNV